MRTIALLIMSNVFMTFAWYGHLRFKESPIAVAILASWGIALFEYMLQVPANRYGYFNVGFTLGQLKVLQEVITMVVFSVFAFLYMRKPLGLDFLYASLCLIGAAYFIFRGGVPGTGH